MADQAQTPAAGSTPAADTTSTQASTPTTPAPQQQQQQQQQQAPKEQPTSTATTTDAGKKADATAAAELVIKLPEGTKVDEKTFGKFKDVLKAQGLNSVQAQAIVDHQLALVADNQKAYAQAIEARRLKDIETLKADKDFGGPKYEQTVAKAQKAEKLFLGEEGSKLLQDLGLNNAPAIVKALARIGDAISEDSIAGTVTPGESAKPTRTQELKKTFDHPSSQQAIDDWNARQNR